MHGGKHQGPSVFAHFLPGMISGFVIGAIVGTLIVTHIATSSLRLFWQAIHEDRSMSRGTCAQVSALKIARSEVSESSSLTTLTIGSGTETLITVDPSLLRYIPSGREHEAYLTAVVDPYQQEAFPATTLYHIDYCAQTVTPLLGGSQYEVTVHAVSPLGTWIVYSSANQLFFMQTVAHVVLSAPSTIDFLPEEVTASLHDNAFALRGARGDRAVWHVTDAQDTPVVYRALPGAALPAWGVRSFQEYVSILE